MPISGCDRVYLARHGRTVLNAEGRLRGLSNPPLDDIGRVEAE
ncbi:MAG TPA: phosphoglycerate mutase family protein, partial [Mycobacterium sp.]|nr:phosphoglycerate mutase family protein [Mycobacterium sp.]